MPFHKLYEDGRGVWVDEEDAHLLSQATWCLDSRGVCRRWSLLHREITGCPYGMFVDHINGNPSDNRRANLRIVTHAENMMNVVGKGYSYNASRQKWEARFRHNGINIFVGRYDTEQEACDAVNKKKLELRGSATYLHEIAPSK